MGHKVENTSLTPTVFKKEAYAVKFPLPVCMCVQERERERMDYDNWENTNSINYFKTKIASSRLKYPLYLIIQQFYHLDFRFQPQIEIERVWFSF